MVISSTCWIKAGLLGQNKTCFDKTCFISLTNYALHISTINILHCSFMFVFTPSPYLGSGWLSWSSKRLVLPRLWVQSLAEASGEFSSPELIFCSDFYLVSAPPHVIAVALKDPVIQLKVQVASCMIHLNPHTSLT